jgi:hypothetical protein
MTEYARCNKSFPSYTRAGGPQRIAILEEERSCTSSVAREPALFRSPCEIAHYAFTHIFVFPRKEAGKGLLYR